MSHETTTIDTANDDPVTLEAAPYSDFPKEDLSALEDGYSGALPPPEMAVDPDNYAQQLEQFFAKDGDDEQDAVETDDEPGADAAADATPAADAEPTWDNVDPRLMDTARQFGFSEAEAKAFPSPRVLHNTLWRMSQALSGQRQPTSDDATSAAQAQETATDDGLDEEVYPPELVRHIRELRNELSTVKGQLQQRVQQPQQEEWCNWFDDRCSETGLPVLGKGRRGELQQPEFQARSEIVSLMSKLGEQFPSDTREQLYERAIAARFPKEIKDQQTKQLSKKLKQRAASAVGSPGRGSAALDDDTSIMAELERERRKMLRVNGDA